MDNPFWSYDVAYWFQQLGSSTNGLTGAKAANILSSSGKKKKTTPRFLKDLKLFLGEFRSPLMLLLIAAVILSAFLGQTSDALIISFIILSTSLLSFLQERNAGRVVEKLQSLIALKSTVLRDGKETEVNSSEIVPGDILVLKAGDIVPADSFF